MSHFVWLSLYLPILIAAPAQHSLAVRAAGTSPRRVRSMFHLIVNTAAIAGAVAVFATVMVWHEWGFLLTVPSGFAIGLRNMRYASRLAATADEARRERVMSAATAVAAIALAAWLIFR